MNGMKKFIFFLLIVVIASCKEKYKLPFEQPDTGYLVIEGVINCGQDTTSIELSRTNKVNSTQKQYEKGALVKVEGSDNSTAQLVERGTGVYTGQLNLSISKQYRLRIKTAAGKEYLSDFVDPKITPVIDSISWKRESDGGVRLHFNTHDAQNNTRYYKWDYAETWEIHSEYRSTLEFFTEVTSSKPIITIGYRDSVTYGPDTLIFKCWTFANSTNLLIGSSARLSSDIIYELPFLRIPPGDRKISELYSIYVQQYALTKEAYEFLEKMKKNTEQNGSIFDAQPSQLKGNIHCVSIPDEPVIGFISVSTVTKKRLFISKAEVPSWNYDSGCQEEKVLNDADSIADAKNSGGIPTNPLVLSPRGAIVYFGVSSPACVDCTTTGTNIKPVFWP